MVDGMTVGIVGCGFVGGAVRALFDGAGMRVLVHDRDPSRSNASLADVAREADFVFVAVPTPMERDGRCRTSIVEEALAELAAATLVAGTLPIVVLKSTVPPGFTRRMLERHRHLTLVFMPEFLTERNAVADFKHASRLVVGTDNAVAYERICQLFRRARRDGGAGCTIVSCSPLVAELAKLFTNAILATRVTFANEFYKLCGALGVAYEQVRGVACLDPRINRSHTDVPGHDGRLGFGGSCFPKDINNLRAVCRDLGVGERLFSAVIERNEELRPERDWEVLVGRAVAEGK